MNELPEEKTAKENNASEHSSFFNAIKIIVGDIVKTLVFSIIVFLIVNALSDRVRIESVSMQPTMYAGDFVFINKLAYKFNTPHRGDIIIFPSPVIPSEQPYIKRIIGIPGDRIQIENGIVFVNRNNLHENYIKTKPNYAGEWLVPANAYFVLGDNRNRSSDSHNWGMVPAANIIGKAIFIYFPIPHWRTFHSMDAFASAP